MSEPELHLRQAFAARLTVMALADLPLEAVASRAAKRRSPGETWQVTAQRLSDWQNGGHLPNRTKRLML